MNRDEGFGPSYYDDGDNGNDEEESKGKRFEGDIDELYDPKD